MAPIGGLALGYVASRAIYRTFVGSRRRAINRLFERVVAETEAAIESARASEAALDPASARTALGPGEG